MHRHSIFNHKPQGVFRCLVEFVCDLFQSVQLFKYPILNMLIWGVKLIGATAQFILSVFLCVFGLAIRLLVVVLFALYTLVLAMLGRRTEVLRILVILSKHGPDAADTYIRNLDKRREA